MKPTFTHFEHVKNGKLFLNWLLDETRQKNEWNEHTKVEFIIIIIIIMIRTNTSSTIRRRMWVYTENVFRLTSSQQFNIQPHHHATSHLSFFFFSSLPYSFTQSVSSVWLSLPISVCRLVQSVFTDSVIHTRSYIILFMYVRKNKIFVEFVWLCTTIPSVSTSLKNVYSLDSVKNIYFFYLNPTDFSRLCIQYIYMSAM